MRRIGSETARGRTAPWEYLAQFIFYATPIGLATALAMFLFYHFDVQMVDQKLHETEHHHLYMRDVIIRQNTETALAGLRLLAELESVPAGAAGEGRTWSDRMAVFCAHYPQFQAIRTVTPTGTVLDAVSCAPDGAGAPLRSPRLSGLPADLSNLEATGVFISGIEVETRTGSTGELEAIPLIRLATPIDGHNAADRRLLVVDADLRCLLSDVAIDTGQGGTMMLVESNGRFVRKPQGEERWGDTLLPGRELSFGTEFPEAWEHMQKVQDSLLKTEAGLFAYSTLNLSRELSVPVRPSGALSGSIHAPVWKIVSIVPQHELHAGMDRSIEQVALLIPAPLLVALYLAHIAVRRRRAARELMDNERYLRRIMDSVVDAIVTTDDAGRIERANAATLTLFGLQSAAKLPRNVSALVPSEVLAATAQWRGDGAALDPEPRPVRTEFTLQRPDGRRFPAEIVRMDAELGGLRRVIWIIRDMSERQAMEARQTAERMRFFHQTKMAEIGLIAAGIIHEVGNPITAIAGMVAELEQEANATPNAWSRDARDKVSLIAQHAERLSGITREISDFVRSRPGTVELFDLNSLVRSTARLVGYDARWKRIALHLQLDPQLPAVPGIQDQLTQVLINLLVNAADAVQERPESDRHVTISTAQQGRQVLMTVQDNGVGMDRETLKRAFESFFTTKPEGKGTGLGLSLCQSILQTHKGSIDIESTEGQGTRIRVLLPTETEAAALAG